jgi:hypothetical protein
MRLHNAREASVPVADRIALDSQGLGLSGKGAVQLDFDISDLGESHSTVAEETPIAFLLRVGERVVTVLRSEAGVSRLFPTSLDPTKEGPKGQVEPVQRFLHGLGMTRCEPQVFAFPARDQLDRVVFADRLLALFPGGLAGGERLVIHPPATIKLALQGSPLGRGWIETILEALAHGRMVSWLLYKYKFCIESLQ